MAGGLVRPQAILFACTENAVRSPMAEALGRTFFGRSVFFASAGVKRGIRDPFVTTIMDEIGIDVARHRPQTFDDLEDASFDLIVTLSPEAHHKALDFTRTLAADVVYWPTMDATANEGSRDQMLDGYRNVREGLMRRITALLGTGGPGAAV